MRGIVAGGATIVEGQGRRAAHRHRLTQGERDRDGFADALIAIGPYWRQK